MEAKEKKELFRSRAILYEAPGGRLSPGHYRFPFLFVLPSDIPGSASVAGADVGRDEAGESVGSCPITLIIQSLGLYTAAPFFSSPRQKLSNRDQAAALRSLP